MICVEHHAHRHAYACDLYKRLRSEAEGDERMLGKNGKQCIFLCFNLQIASFEKLCKQKICVKLFYINVCHVLLNQLDYITINNTLI